jgi:molecular chaperone GrpE
MPEDVNTPIDLNAPAGETEALQAKLEATEQELHNFKLRLADYDNARKRLLRDVEVQVKFATESLARDLLVPLDNLERALAAAKKAGGGGPLAAGVAATTSQFLDVLRRHGVTRIECGPGSTFDPNVHEAVAQQPTNDFEPGQVVDVLQTGFMIHDRVLRPAGVVVATEPPAGGSND